MNSYNEVIKSRVSAFTYDPSRSFSEDQVSELIELATRAPSAFNLQNWRFIAVHSDESKRRLLPLSWGQGKVIDAAVTVIVCGTLNQHLTIRDSLRPTLEAGILDEATFEAWVGAAQSMYQHDSTLQRDEAIRSGALAGATLMLAAAGMGFASTPMIGFDAAGVAAEFDIPATEVPVMMITIGYPGETQFPQKPRKSVEEVLRFI
jgi:nitroreductase